MFIIFWVFFLMVEETFLSSLVKQSMIISNKLVYSSWYNLQDARLKTKHGTAGQTGIT